MRSRPIDLLTTRLERVFNIWRSNSGMDQAASAASSLPTVKHVVVVGGGAAGVELAFAVGERIRKEFGETIDAQIRLIESHETVLPQGSVTLSKRVLTEFSGTEAWRVTWFLLKQQRKALSSSLQHGRNQSIVKLKNSF